MKVFYWPMGIAKRNMCMTMAQHIWNVNGQLKLLNSSRGASRENVK